MRLAGRIRAIRNDPALLWYGVFLALAHAVCMLYWRQAAVINFLGRGSEAVCWPLIPGCEAIRVLSVPELAWVLRGYFAAALLVAALFMVRRFAVAGYAGLLALSIFQLLFVALDFRLRANQVYMSLWATAVYLFVPAGRDALRALLVMFYVWAGTLKLNPEWISGAALPVRDWIIPASLTVAACIYLIALEMGISWGLLARRSWLFWGAFAQFLIFHTVSWQQVGFFFPMTMFCLLAILPLGRLVPGGEEAGSLLGRLVRGRAAPGVYGVMAAFSLFQLPPLLIPGDAAVTGEGRSYALHMVDGGIICRGWAEVRGRDGSVREVVLSGKAVARIACDPILIAERARNICQGTSSRVSGAVDLDLHLTARRSSEPVSRTVIDLPGFCSRRIRYQPFGRNDWILLDGGPSR